MEITPENFLLLASVMIFLSIIASKTSFRFGIPALLLFLAVGIVTGSEGLLGIEFNDPKQAQFTGIIALIFILFSGGLDTKWQSIRPVLWRGLSLATLGVIATAGVVGAFVYYFAEFSLVESLLLGAIVSSTDASAVFSILRTRSIGLKGRIRPVLELESGSNDPMAYFLTVSLTTLAMMPEKPVIDLVFMFFIQMILGAVIGYSFGVASVYIINHIKLDVEGLYPVLLMGISLFTFAFTDFAGGNGFLAVYLAALKLGNSDFIHKRSLMKFYDGVAWLMQVVMFLTLGLLVFPSRIIPIAGFGLAVSLVLMLVARPLGVYISLIFFRINFREKLFISWVGLRGAVPIILATYPLIAGLPSSEMIFNVVFFISATSVLLQGMTLATVARWLHVYVPDKIRRRSQLEIELSDGTKSELTEIILHEHSPCLGKPIVELHFPPNALIVMIKRNNKFITPNGATELQAGDKLTIMAEDRHALDEVLLITGI